MLFIMRKLRFIKRLLFIAIIVGLFLALTVFFSQKALLPSLALSKDSTSIDPQEVAALQTTLQLRLASEAVKALTQGKEEITLVISQEELDLLIRDQILAANTPPEVKFLGSKFTITGNQGHLLVGMRLLNKINISLTAAFAVGYQNDNLIFYLDQLKLGRFPLPEKTTIWLLEKLARQHEPSSLAAETGQAMQFFPTTKEIYFPFAFSDDNLTLTGLAFAPGKGKAGVLAVEFHLNTRQMQRQLLDEIKKAVPPNLIPKELLPYLQ